MSADLPRAHHASRPIRRAPATLVTVRSPAIVSTDLSPLDTASALSATPAESRFPLFASDSSIAHPIPAATRPVCRARPSFTCFGDRDANGCVYVLYCSVGAPALGQDEDSPHSTSTSASDVGHDVVVALDGHDRMACCSPSSTTRAATAAGPSSSPRTGGWRWRRATSARGALTLTGMLSLDALTATRARLSAHLPGGRGVSGPTDCRSTASARFPDAGCSDLACAAERFDGPDYRRRTGRRTGARAGRVHASAVGRGKSCGSARASHARLHAHLDGRVTASIDHGPWTIESSIFNGREPDDNRWDIMDPGPLDSWSARVWFKPSAEWQFQVSYGFLTQPEADEPGDERRTTASGSWFKAVRRLTRRSSARSGRTSRMTARSTHFSPKPPTSARTWSTYGRVESRTGGDGTASDRRARTRPTAQHGHRGNGRRGARFRALGRHGMGGRRGRDGLPCAAVAAQRLRQPPFFVSHFPPAAEPGGHMGRMWNMVMSQPMR